MTTCDDILAAVLLGTRLDDAAAAHVETCARCRADAPAVRRVSAALAAAPVPERPRDLAAGVLRAAAPLLAENERRAAAPRWGALARAVGAALVPLPAILFLDAQLLRAAHAVLSVLLPDALSFYLVFNYAALLALLLALTYGAIPLVAARRPPPRRTEAHG